MRGKVFLDSSRLRELWNDGNLVVHAAMDLESVKAIRKTLDCFAAHPKADPELYLSNIEKNRDSICPAVMVAHKGDKAVGLLLGRIESKELVYRIGYITFYRTRARVLAIDDRGAIDGDNPEVASVLIQALMRLMRDRVADYTHLACLAHDSLLREQAIRIRPWYCRNLWVESESRWVLALPQSYDAFLAARSHKTRSHIRQNERKLLRKHPNIRVITLRPGDPGMLSILDEVMAVFQKTYQYRLGISPLCDRQALEKWKQLCRLQRLMLVLLYVDERPVAFCHAQLYKDTAALLTPGYDPDFAQVNVGQYALLQLIRALIAEGNLCKLDYGLGYSQYKESLGTYCTQEGHVRIFGPSPKGVWLNLVQGITGISAMLLRRAAEKLRLTSTLKRMLRRRFASA